MFDSPPSRRSLRLALCCSLAIAGCAGSEEGSDRGRPVPTVGYLVVQPSTAAIPTTLAGRVVAQETSEVRPQITGLVQSINFQPGGYVRAGQPLFRIDASLYQGAAAEARAALASAEANARDAQHPA